MNKRKNRANPMREGSLQEIYQHFFKPLLKYCPVTMDHTAWLEVVFNLDTRTFTRWQVSRGFKMPGMLLVLPNKPVAGLGYRQMRRGQVILTRHDAVTNTYDVEFTGLENKPDQVFRLNEYEWKSIVGKLLPVEWRSMFSQKVKLPLGKH